MTSIEAAAELAEQVLIVLQKHDVSAVVIGGVALAAHHYLRSTEDLDLGVNATRATMRAVRDDLLLQNYTVEFREPDGDDPLGGTIDVIAESGAMVQIVNFDNTPSGGFPKVISDAIAALGPSDGGLPIAPLPYLVAMKLYARGDKSFRDVRALVQNNPDADWNAIRALCQNYRLKTYGLF